MRTRSVLLGIAALAVSITATTTAAADRPGSVGPRARRHFEFGLWGDMPYAKPPAPDLDTPKLPALIADMNDGRLAFSVFDGDIKSGSTTCDDPVYTQAIDRFNQLRAPVVYVPGDNEWTDCHRINNGGYNALERLDHVRSTMFASSSSFGQSTMALVHQGPPGGTYAENTRWTFGGIVFVGLNVPGSNNNKVGVADCLSSKSVRTQADCDADNAEYAARDAANLEWVRQSFAVARAIRAPGVMFVIQADPSFDLPETETIDERGTPGFDGYDKLLASLTAETKAFAGQVVLVHGDTHAFKVDKPLVHQSDLLENFTRVETFGSPNIDWVKVTVDPATRSVFTFEPMIVPHS